jgi:UDP-N-acetylmuramate dehydrogenase
VSLLKRFDDIKQDFVALSGVTTFRIGGPARFMAAPGSLDQLVELLSVASSEGLDVRILGGGSNLLVADKGLEGLVVRLGAREFSAIEFLPGAVRCGAGVSLSRLVSETAAAGLSGLEGLAGIPGSVGGALVMNAGGRYGCLADTVESLSLVDMQGRETRAQANQCGFGYRSSDLDEMVVTHCQLKLTPDEPEIVQKRRAEILAEKKSQQPLAAASAGCIFRNPSKDQPAARLIDAAGLKGCRIGGARVSEKHANFIINENNASCSDVLELIETVRQAVRKFSDVDLELEIELWSDDG